MVTNTTFTITTSTTTIMQGVLPLNFHPLLINTSEYKPHHRNRIEKLAKKQLLTPSFPQKNPDPFSAECVAENARERWPLGFHDHDDDVIIPAGPPCCLMTSLPEPKASAVTLNSSCWPDAITHSDTVKIERTDWLSLPML